MASNDVHNEDSNKKQFKGEDLLQYCDIFSTEFNKSALHDRILVLKVMKEDYDVKLPEKCHYDEVNGTTEDNPTALEEELEKVSTNKSALSNYSNGQS